MTREDPLARLEPRNDTEFSTLGEAELVRRALARDGEAFRAIMQRHNGGFTGSPAASCTTTAKRKTWCKRPMSWPSAILPSFVPKQALSLGSPASRSTRRLVACAAAVRPSTCQSSIPRKAMGPK